MKTIAFFGSSTVAGRGPAFNILSYLQNQHKDFEFKNLGSDGDTAFDGLQRIDDVLNIKPDITFILLGANDVLVNIFPKMKKFQRLIKASKQETNINLFEMNLRAIVQTLKIKTNSKIVLCSLGMVGENITNPSIIQQQINDGLKSYSSIIKKIASEEEIDYLPFYENSYKEILVNPNKNFDEFKIFRIVRDNFRSIILKWSPDKIGERNGWKFHSDGIHLNSKGAKKYYDNLKLDYPKLSDYELLSIAVQMQQNDILVAGLFLLIMTGQILYGQTTNKEKAFAKGQEAVKLIDSGNLDESINLLKEAQKLDPERIDYPYELALAHYLKEDYKGAIKILEKDVHQALA